jgi:hypothetical protein
MAKKTQEVKDIEAAEKAAIQGIRQVTQKSIEAIEDAVNDAGTKKPAGKKHKDKAAEQRAADLQETLANIGKHTNRYEKYKTV